MVVNKKKWDDDGGDMISGYMAADFVVAVRWQIL
jgi:hypothetical protein